MGIFSSIFKEAVDVVDIGIAVTKDVVKSPIRLLEQVDCDSGKLDLLEDTKQTLEELKK